MQTIGANVCPSVYIAFPYLSTSAPDPKLRLFIDRRSRKKYNRKSLFHKLKAVPRSRFWGSRDEKNLSTEPHQASQDPRFPRTHGHKKWAQSAEGTPRKGTCAPGDLIDRLSSGKPVNTRFQRQARLCRPGDFRDVFAKPKKSVDSCFMVLARENGRSSARLGLAISKKCARRAVDRNRLKRIVRESFRQHRDHLEGIDFVVLCRRGSLTSPSSRLFSSLSAHWKRIRDQLCVNF